jgi:hypothetical protein
VYEVKDPRRQLVDQQIVRAHLQIGVAQSLQNGRVEVGGQHRPLAADHTAEPLGDRAATGPDLEAAPARLDPALLQERERSRIEQRGQQRQSLPLDRERIRERVRRFTTGHPPMPARGRFSRRRWGMICLINLRRQHV